MKEKQNFLIALLIMTIIVINSVNLSADGKWNIQKAETEEIFFCRGL